MLTDPVVTCATLRAAHVNALLGTRYSLGAAGPEAFDCYGLARHLQRLFFGRDLPLFQAPAEAGRIALASIIAAHPERRRWRTIPAPVDGCMVSMARSDIGYHMGTYLDLDGGIVVHTLESPGVMVERLFVLAAPHGGWRKVTFHARD